MPVKPNPPLCPLLEDLGRTENPPLRVVRAFDHRVVPLDEHDHHEITGHDRLDDLTRTGASVEQAGRLLLTVPQARATAGLPAEWPEDRHVIVLHGIETLAAAQNAIDPRLPTAIDHGEQVLEVRVTHRHQISPLQQHSRASR